MSEYISCFAFYGIAFHTPPITANGDEIMVGSQPLELYDAHHIDVLALGPQDNLNSIAIFAEGSYFIADPMGGGPVTQKLIAKPGWRENLIQFCRLMGLQDPPEPSWVLSWTRSG